MKTISLSIISSLLISLSLITIEFETAYMLYIWIVAAIVLSCDYIIKNKDLKSIQNPRWLKYAKERKLNISKTITIQTIIVTCMTIISLIVDNSFVICFTFIMQIFLALNSICSLYCFNKFINKLK